MTYDTKGLSMNCHNIPKFASYFWTVLNEKELAEIIFLPSYCSFFGAVKLFFSFSSYFEA